MTVPVAWKPRETTPENAAVEATAQGLVSYLEDTERTAADLTDAGALVFRGFHVTPAELPAVMDLLLPHRLAYVHGNSPRTKVGENVYTSTEYPAEQTISMHNEMSYSSRWPARLMFFCEQAAETGGATPIVDGVTWLDSLGDDVREAFADGVTYLQNLHGGAGFGKSWQDTFETTDREEVERFLSEAGAQWTWNRDALSIRNTRPATTRHPVTGAEVWFNQSDQWHPAGLADDTAQALLQIMREDELPQYVTFADGSPIPADYVRLIRDNGLRHAVDVDWREGDVVVIDNVLVGHGRRPYTGGRRILVAMSD
jgi:alpha-ketoglutarate-dependent taurine dioxygenase